MAGKRKLSPNSGDADTRSSRRNKIMDSSSSLTDDAKNPSAPSKAALQDLDPSPQASKKVQLLRANAAASPFPTFPRPTPEECQAVCDALAEVHGMPQRPDTLKADDSNRGSACGQVPDVLDALVRTILSQNTSNANSKRAKEGLDAAFGRDNYEAVRQATVEEVEASIKSGGLANKKAVVIKAILDETYAKYGKLSLDHLAQESDEKVMETLVSFNGVGPKTASCVLLFCLRRESFAVDTHVYRLSKALSWIPASATRDTAYHHLDLRIPAALKYPLHCLFIKHGRGCKSCSANGVAQKQDRFEGPCPIRGFLGGRKAKDVKAEPELEESKPEGPIDGVPRRQPKGKKAKKEDDSEAGRVAKRVKAEVADVSRRSARSRAAPGSELAKPKAEEASYHGL